MYALLNPELTLFEGQPCLIAVFSKLRCFKDFQAHSTLVEVLAPHRIRFQSSFRLRIVDM